MNAIKLYPILLVSLLFSLNVLGMSSLPTALLSPQDSLVLQKGDSDKQIVIHTGQTVKAWLNDKTKTKGVFESLQGDQLIIKTQEGKQTLALGEVKKIRTFNKGFSALIGVLFLIFGLGALFFGGLSLLVGIISAIFGELGAIVLVAVPFLSAGGFLFYAMGSRLIGRTFNLLKRWRIVHS